MARLTDENVGGSFHQVTIFTTVNELRKAVGHAQCEDNTGNDKVNFDWACVTDDGKTFFTIYDWKEYQEIGEDELINFHIGGNNKEDCLKAQRELIAQLK